MNQFLLTVVDILAYLALLGKKPFWVPPNFLVQGKKSETLLVTNLL